MDGGNALPEEERGAERLSAHERLSTGALARWARPCATHPWRVVFGWVGIVAVLIVLVATVGGSLRDEFEIPGLGHAEGDRPDRVGVRLRAGRRAERRLRGARGRAARHARAQGGDRGGDRAARRRREFKPDGRTRRASRASAIRSARTRSPTTAASPTPRRSSTETIEDKDRDAVVAVEDAVREAVEPAGVTVEYNGEAEFPPIEQGTSEAARPARGDHRAADRLPHVRGDADPDRAGDHGAGDGVPAALHPRRPDRHQHDHADPRLDDRARRRHRLLAVHRHALQTAPARRALAARRRRRGRRVRGPRRALRRPDGRDLGDRPGVHRPRLRDQARHRQRARRADHGADRELAAARGAGAARPQDRPAEGAVPAADRRLRGGAREDARRALGPVRDRRTRGSSSRSCWS